MEILAFGMIGCLLMMIRVGFEALFSVISENASRCVLVGIFVCIMGASVFGGPYPLIGL